MPAADEGISYQIPSYKLRGAMLIYLAGWKEHYSLYPATAGVIAAYGEQLGARHVSKGTLRFSLTEAIPSKLIAGIAKVRAQEVQQALLAKTARKQSKAPAPRANVVTPRAKAAPAKTARTKASRPVQRLVKSRKKAKR